LTKIIKITALFIEICDQIKVKTQLTSVNFLFLLKNVLLPLAIEQNINKQINKEQRQTVDLSSKI